MFLTAGINLVLMITHLDLIIILCVLGGLLIFGLLIFLIIKTRHQKHPRIKVNEEFINQLVQALGKRKNILEVRTINGRIHFEVEDLELVDVETLKKLSTAGVFITNNTIKMLFNYDSDAICKAVMNISKEE